MFATRTLVFRFFFSPLLLLRFIVVVLLFCPKWISQNVITTTKTHNFVVVEKFQTSDEQIFCNLLVSVSMADCRCYIVKLYILDLTNGCMCMCQIEYLHLIETHLDYDLFTRRLDNIHTQKTQKNCFYTVQAVLKVQKEHFNCWSIWWWCGFLYMVLGCFFSACHSTYSDLLMALLLTSFVFSSLLILL